MSTINSRQMFFQNKTPNIALCNPWLFQSKMLPHSKSRDPIANIVSSILGLEKKKLVQFNRQVAVVLIPTRTECVEAGLADALWWNVNDYSEFKTDAVSEIKEYAATNNIHIFQSITDLYQPNLFDKLISNLKSSLSVRSLICTLIIGDIFIRNFSKATGDK